ncbi:MAG: phytanoyl-CoA dioxygenase family protein [Armatimonadetes bacterium]|nr:phytanoyl-CoA dioxygenase family protein [Armatimonadota bacterium]
MTSEEVQSHAVAIQVDGYTVLPDLLSSEQVAAMLTRFEELIAAKRAAEPFNRGPNRFQMYLPWEPPFTTPDLYRHPRVLELVQAVMGPDPALVYFASDTPLPGSDYQKVHSDTRLLFPEEAHSLPAYGLVLNVPLVDCSEENGSLEFWPGGTHRIPVAVDRESLAAGMQSARANLPAGHGLLRDLRMWHRGTPNRSGRLRPHLALVYVRPWYRFEQEVPSLTRAAFAALDPAGQRLLRYARIY